MRGSGQRGSSWGQKLKFYMCGPHNHFLYLTVIPYKCNKQLGHQRAVSCFLIELWPIRLCPTGSKAPTGALENSGWMFFWGVGGGLSHSQHLDLLSELDGVQLTCGRHLYNEGVPCWIGYLFMFHVFTAEFHWLLPTMMQLVAAQQWYEEKLCVKTWANSSHILGSYVSLLIFNDGKFLQDFSWVLNVPPFFLISPWS